MIANGTGEEKISVEGNDFVLTWEVRENATECVIQRADSLFGTYTTIETVTDTTITVPVGENKYANYYRVIARKNNDEYERSDVSESVSLEKNLFGENTIIFAPTDDTDKIDELLGKLLEQQNDIEKDAQFNSRQWQVYFKPGDYTDTACMYLGFYTSFNGLGKVPTDVKLNNLAIPAYLTEAPNGQQYCTSINTTDKIAEKPFLFFDEDDHEYKVFVPAVKENAAGTSWGGGKANDGMSEGEILSLDKFYDHRYSG